MPKSNALSATPTPAQDPIVATPLAQSGRAPTSITSATPTNSGSMVVQGAGLSTTLPTAATTGITLA